MSCFAMSRLSQSPKTPSVASLGLRPQRLAIFSCSLVSAIVALTSGALLFVVGGIGLGVAEGDAGLRLLLTALVLSLGTPAALAHHDCISRQAQVEATLLLGKAMVVAVPAYACLSEATLDDRRLVMLAAPYCFLLFAFVRDACESHGLMAEETGHWLADLCRYSGLALLALTWRSVIDPKSQHLVFEVAVFLPLACAIRGFGQHSSSAAAAARRELIRESEENQKAQRDLRDVRLAFEEAKRASLSILSAVCNAVVELDGSFTVRKPAPELEGLLAQGDADGDGGVERASLQGRSLLDILASPEDVKRLTALLSAPTFLRAGEESTALAAPTLRAELRGEGGCTLPADLIHATFTDIAGEKVHLVGVVVLGKTPGITKPSRDAAKAADEATPPCACSAAGAGDDRGAATASCRSCLTATDSRAKLPPPPHRNRQKGRDRSVLAFRFDGGCPRFGLSHGNAISGAPPRLKARGPRGSLLEWVSAEQASDFEAWVISEVNRHAVAEAEGDDYHPARFPGSVMFNLPPEKPRSLQAAEAMLEIHPPDEGGNEELPLTLWLRRVSIVRPGTLTTLDEETTMSAGQFSHCGGN